MNIFFQKVPAKFYSGGRNIKCALTTTLYQQSFLAGCYNCVVTLSFHSRGYPFLLVLPNGSGCSGSAVTLLPTLKESNYKIHPSTSHSSPFTTSDLVLFPVLSALCTRFVIRALFLPYIGSVCARGHRHPPSASRSLTVS